METLSVSIILPLSLLQSAGATDRGVVHTLAIEGPIAPSSGQVKSNGTRDPSDGDADKPPGRPEKLEPLEVPNSLGLYRWGLSAGAGLALVLPLAQKHRGESSSQTNVSAGGIAYLAWNPAVSFTNLGHITREYCTSRLGFATRKQAQRRANTIAVQDAWDATQGDIKTVQWESLQKEEEKEAEKEKADRKEKAARKEKEEPWKAKQAQRLFCKMNAADELSHHDPGSIIEVDEHCPAILGECATPACSEQREPRKFTYEVLSKIVDLKCGVDKKCFARARDELKVKLAAYTETGWLIAPENTGSCGRFFAPGIYAGYIFGLKGGNFTVDGIKDVPEKVATLGSFGLAWTPTPYLSILVGLTVVKVPIPPRTEMMDDVTTQIAPGRFATSIQPVISIGGTLDIFTKLLE